MKKDNLYIMMFSIHGLLRSENMEMGRDADTGGQIKYVVEVARALGENPNVRKVDLFTRLINDKTVSEDYAQPIEEIGENSRIVRIQCGGRKYMRKELLWPYLEEYIDKTLKYIKKENDIPDLVHGHYADAGYVASEIAKVFGIPFVFTGHSLGRSKLGKLLDDGMKKEDIIKKYKIDHRIDVEEQVLKDAELVITSTNQEVKTQYGQYNNTNMARYAVIPPGIDLDKFYPYHHDMMPDSNKDEREILAQASIRDEMNRFFMNPDRPVVLALCRPDQRKNISGLIKAYGEDMELQAMANLAIFAGIRKDISDKEENERAVLTDMLLLMDKYDLYGKMSIPKKHDFEWEVPELYRIAAEKRGVFANVAFTEPFGLTLIEASGTGLPIVATDDGGPRDIMSNCKNGILVDVTDTKSISEAIKEIIVNPEKWKEYSQNGILNVREYYSWDSHVESYLKELSKLPTEDVKKTFSTKGMQQSIGKRLTSLSYLLVTDIDYTLIGGDNEYLDELKQLLDDNSEYIGFGVATGRTIESALEILKEHEISQPDLIISSVGTEIYYGSSLKYDQGYDAHISKRWNREKIRSILEKFDFLTYQEEDTQRKFKVSYYMEPRKDSLAKVHDALMKNKIRYNLIYSHDQFLDILPSAASKGKAIRYLSYKWEIPQDHMVVSGDSGNDEEMLRGDPLGVVVGNYSSELERLKGMNRVYFAEREFAGGIIEGIQYYKIMEKAKGEV